MYMQSSRIIQSNAYVYHRQGHSAPLQQEYIINREESIQHAYSLH